MTNLNSPTWNFAVIVDGEVAQVLIVDNEAQMAAYSSNPTIAPLLKLWEFPNGKTHQGFNVVVENELAMTIGYDISDEALIASLSSNPTIIPINPSDGIVAGWTWDGTNFKAPE
jgi:hypothetical protein